MAVSVSLHSIRSHLRHRAERLQSRLYDWYRRHKLAVHIGSLVFAFFFVYLLPSMLVSIYPGEIGVIWRRFFGGTDIDTTDLLHEGTALKLPWDLVYRYDSRMQTITTTFFVLTAGGLSMEVQITARFRLNPKYVGLLHRHIGPHYIDTVLTPELSAHGRDEISKLQPEELYTGKRHEVQERILELLQNTLNVRYLPDLSGEDFIYLEDILIRNITLPPLVAEAIQAKYVQQQRLEEYEFRLKKEELEKQRKKIEGEGIQLFQSMVTQGISEEFLKWKGINATLELAKSNNSKIVIIGAGEGGLPLILGNMDSPSVPVAAAPAEPGPGPQPLPVTATMATASTEDQINGSDTPDSEPGWPVDKP